MKVQTQTRHIISCLIIIPSALTNTANTRWRQFFEDSPQAEDVFGGKAGLSVTGNLPAQADWASTSMTADQARRGLGWISDNVSQAAFVVWPNEQLTYGKEQIYKRLKTRWDKPEYQVDSTPRAKARVYVLRNAPSPSQVLTTLNLKVIS